MWEGGEALKLNCREDFTWCYGFRLGYRHFVGRPANVYYKVVLFVNRLDGLQSDTSTSENKIAPRHKLGT